MFNLPPGVEGWPSSTTRQNNNNKHSKEVANEISRVWLSNNKSLPFSFAAFDQQHNSRVVPPSCQGIDQGEWSKSAVGVVVSCTHQSIKMTAERWAMIALLVVGVLQSATSVNGAYLEVGGDNGWTFPPNGIATFFNDWANQNTFHVGDTLFFRYKFHSVLEVSQADVASCTTTSPINTYNSAENATVTLDRTGYYGFICGFPSHCVANMKLELTSLAPGQTAPTPPGVANGPSGALAPSPSSDGKSAASSVQSLSAMIVGALFGGSAFLFL